MTDIQGLLLRLPMGWSASSPILGELLNLWREAVGPAHLTDSDSNYAEFTADLGKIKLRGMDDVRCLAISGRTRTHRHTVKAFIDRVKAPGQAILVLAPTPDEFSEAQRQLSGVSQCGLLGRADLGRVFAGPDDRSRFVIAAAFRRYSSRLGLIPFSIDVAARPNMFFGRESELEWLAEEETTNFAITGPGKIGKTSLVKQYLHYLRRSGKSSQTFYVDLHETLDRSATNWPSFVAKRLAGTSWSQTVTLESFPQFLKLFKSKILKGRTPTIILDEMDEVVSDSENVRQIIAAVEKQGLCRFIICGRAEVYKAVRNNSTGLGGRFRVIRLEPLEPRTAEKLLLEPLMDLGLALAEEKRSLEYVIEWTGRLPQLIQFYGQRLVESAVKSKVHEITHTQIEDLSHDFETKQYFLSPLDDLNRPFARLLTYCLLNDDNVTFSPAFVTGLLRKHELQIDAEEVRKVCDELVILNILAWENDTYRLANRAMRYYLSRSGTLDLDIQQALKEYQRQALIRGQSNTGLR
jgi:AAA+ ATPase superfamily predicted ATPase